MNIRKMRSILRSFGYYEAVFNTRFDADETWRLRTTVKGSNGFRSKVENTVYLRRKKGWKVQGYKDWMPSEHSLEGHIADVLFTR